MKLNKILLPISLIYFLLTFVVISQSEHLERLKNINIDKLMFLENATQIDKNNLYKIENNYSVTEGSPFNNVENTQIDSVVIIKGTNTGDEEIIKYFYTYDSCGNIATEVKENSWQQSNTYDTNGNLTNEIFRIWRNEQWINSSQVTNIYNSLDKRVLYLLQYWEDTVLVNDMQNQYFYNSQGDRISYLSEKWDGNKWVNFFRETNTYDSNFVLLSTLNQNWGGDDWNGNTWRKTYSYNSNGNEILFVRETLNNNNWENTDRIISTYDKKEDMVLFYWEEWENNQWNTRTRYSYIYDYNKNIISSLSEKLEFGKWINSHQKIYSYNSYGDLSFARYERWTENKWILSNGTMSIFDSEGNRRNYFGEKMSVYYASLTDIKEKELKVNGYSLSQNYPNPFNPSTTIRYSLPQAGFVQLKIYDLLGRIVANLVSEEQAKGNYKIEFNASNLTSGIYFYRLQSSNFAETKKLSILK